MSKSKKFDAAEKHFEKQRINYRRKIKELEYANKTLDEELCSTRDEIAMLRKKNEHLKQQNDVLMELKDMTTTDVETLIQSKKATHKVASMLDLMTRSY